MSPHTPDPDGQVHPRTPFLARLAVLLAVGVVWATGACGFAEAMPHRGTIDCMLLSAQLFVLHSNVPDTHSVPSHPGAHSWKLELSRVLAPVISFRGLLLFLTAIRSVARWVLAKRAATRPAIPAPPRVEIYVIILPPDESGPEFELPPPTGPKALCE